MYEFAGINRQEQPTIEAMTNQLARCRTGREGYILRDGLSLGYIDSAVLDRREQQPLLTGKEDQTVWVFCSGTIFNISDLKKELAGLGHDIQSGADAETLVHGYRQWGIEMLQRLNGQFALCLFDQSARKLFLARDRFGFKPLYYAFENGRFVFGSQLKAVMHSGINKTLDAVSLNHYLYFGYMPTGRSILQKVYPLQPAHFLIFDLAAGGIEQINRYWTLSFQQSAPRTEEDIAAELADRLGQSVRMRMVGQAPAGVFLSGGLDSSIIVSLMREQTETIKTFSIRFDRPDFDETHYARIVSDRFRAERHEIRFNAEHVRDLMDRLPIYYDEPFADPSMIPAWLVCSAAQTQTAVCMSGTGGDELFGGYPRHREFMILKRLNRLPGFLRKILDGGAALGRGGKRSKLGAFLRQPLTDEVLYYMLRSYMFRRPDEKTAQPYDFSASDVRFDKPCDLDNLLFYDLFDYLPNCLLPKEERAASAFGLEIRMPFLDPEFAEFAAAIPAALKVRGRQKKYILKKAFRSALPAEIVRRKKQGFGVPIAHYFRKELKSFAAEILFSQTAGEYFDSVLLESFWAQHQSGVCDYSRLLWSVMMLTLWHDRWMR